MNRKIGPLLLSGLMIGPILGSGIVLLPPLAYGLLGGGSIWAWLVIMGLGTLFAMIFSKLTILHPGDGGMTNAIEVSLGKKFKLYASLLMIFAVSFGPTAVMLIAAEYLNRLNVLNSISTPLIAIVLVLLSLVMLVRDAKFVSTLSFVLSTIISVTLVISSVVVLLQNGVHITPINALDLKLFGKTVLLLFWAIIGWEIIGNYSSQVKNIKKTIPLATGISIVVITITYLLISLAIQSIQYNDSLSLVEIIQPIFGGAAKWVLALLVSGLCFSTYLLIVGALIRLISSLSHEGYLPKILKKKNNNDVPVNAAIYFILVHILVLSLNMIGILDITGIVNIANAFFLVNAVIGLTAAFFVVKSTFYKLSSIILAISLLIILLFSSADILISLVVVYVIAFVLERKQRKVILSKKIIKKVV